MHEWILCLFRTIGGWQKQHWLADCEFDFGRGEPDNLPTFTAKGYEISNSFKMTLLNEVLINNWRCALRKFVYVQDHWLS